jgi:hypothetical protein
MIVYAPESKGQQRQGKQCVACDRTAALERAQKKTSGNCDICDKIAENNKHIKHIEIKHALP